MPTVTSQNKADFVADRLTKNVPESYSEEPKNAEYMRYAKMAQEASSKAADEKSHGEAEKFHRMAFGLASSQENREYHRRHFMKHEGEKDKNWRKEQSAVRRKSKKYQEELEAKRRIQALERKMK